MPELNKRHSVKVKGSRTYFSKVIFCLLCFLIAVCWNTGINVYAQDLEKSESPRIIIPIKIAPELKYRALNNDRLDVFIILNNQPHALIFEHVKQLYDKRVRDAEIKYQELLGQGQTSNEKLQEANDNLNSLTLIIRQEAAQEIAAAVLPEQNALTALLLALGANSIQSYLMINVLKANIPSSSLTVLELDPSIAEIFPVSLHQAQLDISSQAFGANSFWNSGFTGTGQSVAIMDSGLKSNHPAFSPSGIVSTVWLTNGSQDPCFDDNLTSVDNQGHGTHVAGIAMSRGSNGWVNNQGVAKGLSTLYNLKVAYKCGSIAKSSTADVLAALDWALQNTSVKIFNYSYGGITNTDDDGFTRQIDFLADTYGVNIVIAAGNSGPNSTTVNTPGIGYNIISVANMDDRNTVTRSDDIISNSSSRGPTIGGRNKPDIAAPGTNILSTAYDWDGFFNSDFVSKSGTSMAAPHITGAAALLNQAGVFSSLARKAVLLNTTDEIGWTSDRGWGHANLVRANLQKTFFLTNAVRPRGQPGSFFLYRRSGQISANNTLTMVWNRHIVGGVSIFHDLDLVLYDRLNNILSTSSSIIQNVEQVSLSSASSVVVKVHAFSTSFGGGISTEPFALAVPVSGFLSSTGPSLSINCTAPSNTPSNSTFTVNCTVRNNGDLEAFSVNGALTVPPGFSSGPSQNFGTIAPAAQATRSWNVTAGSATGNFNFQATSSSFSFGETFSANTSFPISVGGCSITVGQGASGSEVTAFQNANSAAGGQAVLGCPSGAVQFNGFTSFAGTTGHFQLFPNGDIEYITNGSRAGQAFAIVNPLFNKWASFGFNSSNPLGYPIGNLSSQSISCFDTNLKFQQFEGGALEHHLSGPRSGSVFEVHGAIYAKWAQKGFANCPLGLPISDVRTAPTSGASGQTGRVSDFEGGRIHWRSGTPTAFETHGAIDNLYVSMGTSSSFLGFPISDEYVASTGFARNDFEGGFITTTDGVNYRAFRYTSTLVVASSNPNSGVSITVNPLDINNQGSGVTQFTRTYNTLTSVRLIAPPTAGGNTFQRWLRNGIVFSTNRDVTVMIDANYMMTADYLGVSSNTPFDFDADSLSDIAVWRPSQGVWFIINSSNGSVRGIQWGVNGDKPVPGDYDGDGRTDIAVWRPSQGVWFIINSSNGSFRGVLWGANGDVPVPSAFVR